MRKITKFICIFFATVFTFGAFAGCTSCVGSDDSGKNNPSTPVVPDDPDDATTEKELPKELDVVLYENGASDYTIVLPASSGEYVLAAEEEFNYFFQDSTGIELPVVQDDKAREFDDNVKYISLGETKLSEEANIDKSAADSRKDGYVIKTVGNSIFVVGTTDYGTLCGVYELLEYMIGLKIYAVDEWAIDKNPSKIMLRDYDNLGLPSLDVRYMGYPGYGDILKKRFRMQDNHGAVYALWAHTTFRLLPKETYYKDHPDWYSASGGQLCWTNEEAFEEMKRVIIEDYASQLSFFADDKMYLMIGHEDNRSFCGDECETCSALLEKYDGKQSALAMLFVNKMQRAVNEYMEKNRPGKTLSLVMFGYGQTLDAPVKKNADGTYSPLDENMIPEKNVGVMYAPLNCNWRHSLFDTKYNANIAESFAGWSSLKTKSGDPIELHIWTYDCVFDDHYVFMDHWGQLQETYKTFIDAGAVYIFDEGRKHKDTPWFSLNSYVSAQLMWDVNQDTETLIDEFMTAYYKDAAPYIKECFNAYRQRYQTLEDEAEAKGETIHFASYISSQPLYKSTEWWPKAWLETTLDTFDKALAAVENSDLDADTKEKVCYRVRAERLSAGYLLMELYHDELTNAEKQAWIDELTDVSDRLGITGYREHSGEMETKINSWRTWITTED